MPKTRLISPGIANHSLKKNLILNDNYLSNDGDDEGIRITDAGLVGIGVTGPAAKLQVLSTTEQLRLDYDATNYASFTVAADGALTIATVDADAEEADLTFLVDGDIIIDTNSISTTEQTTKGLEIDYDHTGSTSSDQEIMGLDVSAISGSTTGGSQLLYGTKIWAQLSAASGAGSTNSFGLHVTASGNTTAAVGYATAAYLKVSGTDTNTGLFIDCEDGGDDLKIVSSQQVADYFKIQVGMNGETTFTTNEAADGNDDAHLNINLDGNFTVDAVGDITLDAAGGDVTILQADLTIPIDKKVIFGNAGEYIVGDDTDLDIVSSNNLNLDGGNLIKLYDDTVHYGSFSKSAGTSLAITSANYLYLNAGDNDYIRLGNGTGFTQVTPTYNATDTNVDFRDGNKQFLTFGSGSEAIADLNLTFPAVSGNFVLVIKQHSGGGGSVASDGWLVFESDGSTPADAAIVQWPGGTEPTLTTGANAVDIVSFYWDATDGATICYGVISQDFQ